jgi:tRNA threonylcarbamoyladenosine biosynthesis protein TsaB
MIDQVCAEAGTTVAGVGGVAVASGPGAFTGLRVGLATAAGLASALGVKVWTAPSLFVRAAWAGFGGELVALLDARKNRVYAARWRDTSLLDGPADVDPELVTTWAQPPFRATGEGALVFRSVLEAAGGTVVQKADHPGTLALAQHAATALARGEGMAPRDLRAEYLREPDAVARVSTTGAPVADRVTDGEG